MIPTRDSAATDTVAIIPACQAAATIEAVTCATAIHQPVIVVDDGSTDGTGEGGVRCRCHGAAGSHIQPVHHVTSFFPRVARAAHRSAGDPLVLEAR